MKQIFFENPLYVYVALGLAELAILAFWYERRSRRLALGLLAPPLLAGVVVLTAWLVVTDREKIERAAGEIAAGVVRNEPELILPHVREDFALRAFGERVTRREIETIFSVRRGWPISKITFHKMRIQVTDARAVMKVTTLLTIDADGGSSDAPQRSALVWDVLWGETDGVWRVVEVRDVRQGLEL